MTLGIRTRRRTIAYVDYREGEEISVDLPTGGLLLETYIRVQYTATNTATPPVGAKLGRAMRVVKRFEMEVAEQDQVVSLDTIGLHLNSAYDLSGTPDSNIQLPTTASAVTDVDVYIPIMHWLPNSQNPLMTGLDLRYVQSAAARLQWADANDFFDTPNGFAVSNVRCEIIGVFFEGLGDEVPIPFVRDLGYKRFFIQNDDDAFQMQFEKRTGRLIRSINLATTRDLKGAFDGGEPVVLNKDIRVFSGGQQYDNVPADFLRERDKMLRQGALPASLYPIPFTNYGDPGQMLDTNRLQSALTIEAGVAGPVSSESVEITALTEYVRPLRIGG